MSDTRGGWSRAVAVAMLAMALPGWRAAAGGLDGRGLVVPVTVPRYLSLVHCRTALDKELGCVAKAGGSGVMVVARPGEKPEMIREVANRAKRRGLKPWVGLPLLGELDLGAAKALVPAEAEGLALIVPTPKAEATDPGDRAALLALKRKGDKLGDAIRQLKRGLGQGKKLAVCVSVAETAPETARGLYVPVRDLVRDGTLDVVCLGEAERYNYHRLRLLRDAPLRAGLFLDGAAIARNGRGGLLARALLAAMANDTCECVWLTGFEPEAVSMVVTHAVDGYRQAEARRKALEEAIAKGLLAIDQQVPAEKCDDQASVHGVGQSFIPSRDGRCPLVQLYVALRRCSGALPPPLKVEIRNDAGGKPGDIVLAATEIRPEELGHEPTYRWGSAQFKEPVPLKGGVKYWIHVPAASYPDGTYVWRVIKDGATKRGNAWSCRYKYEKHTWVFRVYLEKEAAK